MVWCIHSSHPHSRNVAFNYSIVSEGMFGKIHALGVDWRNDAVVTHVCRGRRWMLGGRGGWSGRPQVTHEWSRAPRLTSGAPAWGAIRLQNHQIAMSSWWFVVSYNSLLTFTFYLCFGSIKHTKSHYHRPKLPGRNCFADFAAKECVQHVFRSDEWKWDVPESIGAHLYHRKYYGSSQVWMKERIFLILSLSSFLDLFWGWLQEYRQGHQLVCIAFGCKMGPGQLGPWIFGTRTVVTRDPTVHFFGADMSRARPPTVWGPIYLEPSGGPLHSAAISMYWWHMVTDRAPVRTITNV